MNTNPPITPSTIGSAAGVSTRRAVPARYGLAAAIVAGALACLSGTAGADDGARTAVETDGDRCAQLHENLEFLPAEWPAAQVMRAAADRCVDWTPATAPV